MFCIRYIFFICTVNFLLASSDNEAGNRNKFGETPMEKELLPFLEIIPGEALIDEDTKIVVNNLCPNEIIFMKAEAVDDNNIHWLSHASFQADINGTVDLSLQAPIEGSYRDVDPMGLLWSMEPLEDSSASFAMSKDEFSIDLKIFRGKEELISKKIVRFFKTSDVKRRSICEDGLVGALFLPTTDKPLPVIITLSGSNGGIGENKSKLLASHGFAVFALGYFGLEGLPSELKEIPLEYFEKAFSWVKSQKNLDGSNIGIYGGSRGGELSLILGAWFPEAIQSIVAAVPSSVIYGGGRFSLIQHHSPVAAWTFQGRPIGPLASECLPNFSVIENDFDNPFIETPCFLDGMKNNETFNAAAIPVEKIKANLLLISGGDDQMWPSGIYSFQIEERLKQYNSKIFFEHLHYPKAGHGITIPYLPESSTLYYHPIAQMWFSLGGTRQDNRFACQDSWKKILAFFEKTLKTKSK